MFRVASGATSNNFRPGIRFYFDANCPTADVISTVATIAGVLSRRPITAGPQRRRGTISLRAPH
jgi:hypothetical protein